MLNAKQALMAMAQVYTDYPQVWTTRSNAKNEKNRTVFVAAKSAVKFCAHGFMERLNYEGTISIDTRNLAWSHFSMACHKIYQKSAINTNDDIGREAVIKAANFAADNL